MRLTTDDTPPVVLIVDDQPSNIRVLREAVKDLGSIHFATSGPAAIRLAKEILPDLILLDIEMPGMDGYAVCSEIKSLPALAESAIIFVTAHERAEHELQALSFGGVDFVQKPLNVPVVRARVKTHLALRYEAKQRALAHRDLEDVIHNLPAFIAYWDKNWRNQLCNDRVGAWFGITADAAVGMSLEELMGQACYASVEPYMKAAEKTGMAQSLDLEVNTGRPTRRYSQVSLVPRFEAGDYIGCLMLLADVTERRTAEKQLFAEKERIRVTLNSIGDAVIATDDQGVITFMNPIAETLTEWRAENALGKPIEEVMPLQDGGDGRELRNPIYLALEQKRVVGMALNCKLIQYGGHALEVEDSAAPIRDESGNITGAIVVFHDVSEARAMAIKMTHLANHDALTNLPNRMLLQDRSEQALQQAKRQDLRVAMLLFDIDNFKMINDTLGHRVGDELLVQAAQRLRDSCSSVDTVSRQGGDEFIILLPEVNNVEYVVDTAERLRELLAAEFQIAGESYSFTTSVGISLYPDDSKDIEDLYRHADSAMYQAKQEGKNRYRFFSRDVEESSRSRHELEQSMRQAINDGAFEVHYQAKVDAEAGLIYGAEALVRWIRSDGIRMSPAEFIPLAEELGLIIPLGRFVLQTACKDAQKWRDRGHNLCVSVNISTIQFQEPDFFEMVLSSLAEANLPNNLLELEITEGVLARDITSSVELLEKLRKAGIRVAIDDFGTGYSSLSYLKRFPIDVLKIDQSFVNDMLQDDSDIAIINAIITLGRTLGMELIAEGVEQQEQVDYLLSKGCNLIQGYIYSRPANFDTFCELLENGLD